MAQFEIIPVSGNADIPDVLRRIQTNVAKVVDQLTQAQSPSIQVEQVNANYRMRGTEDVILVDAHAAQSQISIVLPQPQAMTKRLTVHVTLGGTWPVAVKASDIPGNVKIGDKNQLVLPAGSTGTIDLISTGTGFSALQVVT